MIRKFPLMLSLSKHAILFINLLESQTSNDGREACLPKLARSNRIELEVSSLLMYHDAVVAARRFHRHVAGENVGEDALWIAFEWIPKPAAAADLDEKAITDIESDVADGLSCRQSLHRTVFAHDAEAIRHRKKG